MSINAGSSGGPMPPGLTLKAWALIESSGTLTKGQNIASVVKNTGVGAYTVNFTAAMNTALYLCKVHLFYSGSNTVTNTVFLQGNRTTMAAGLQTVVSGALGDCGLYVEFWE